MDFSLGLMGVGDTLNPTEIDVAIDQLQKKVTETPGEAKSWLLLGNSYYLRGKIKKAIDTFEKAIALNPQFPCFHYYLGICLYRTAQMDAAIRSLKKALQLSPTMVMTNYWLGIAYFHKGAYMESRRYFESLLQGDSESSIAHYHAALSCMAGQELDCARKHLEALVNLGNQDPQVFVHLGDVYFRLSRIDDAIAVYSRGLEYNPENLPLQKALSYLTEMQWP